MGYKYKLAQIVYPFGNKKSGARGHEVIDRRIRNGKAEYVIDGVDNCDKIGRYRPYWWKEGEL
jgi:hypothetical protein